MWKEMFSGETINTVESLFQNKFDKLILALITNGLDSVDWSDYLTAI